MSEKQYPTEVIADTMDYSTMRDQEIKKAREIQCTSDSPAERAAALSREFFYRDQIQRESDAREKGRAAGNAEFMKRVARNLHKKQYSIKVIADVTNLSEDEVLRIVESCD